MKNLIALFGDGAAIVWRGVKTFFEWAHDPVNKISIWGGAATFIVAVGALVWAFAWPKQPTIEAPVENVTENVQTPPDPPVNIVEPLPPPPRTQCTTAEETEAFGIMRASIESDLVHYMRRPGEPQVLYRNCRLSGQRYEIVFKMNVPGTLCDDRLRYEAYYSGNWPVDGSRVRLERIGPEFAILLEQKRQLRENPWMPACPR